MTDIEVRKADADDSRDIFEWRNDNLTRNMSRESSRVHWEQHAQWFAGTLENPERLMLICVDKSTNTKIGVVRFDFLNNGTQAEISINISPDARGKGYAKGCLRNGISYVANNNSNCKTIVAEIKKLNEGSKKSFEGIGFSLASEDEAFWQYQYRC